MRIVIDPQKCILCGACETLAPHIFQQNDMEKTLTVDDKAGFSDESGLVLCIESCPVDCIERVYS